MRQIDSPELGIFKEAALTVLEFTDDEYKEIEEIAQDLKYVLERAKDRKALSR